MSLRCQSHVLNGSKNRDKHVHKNVIRRFHYTKLIEMMTLKSYVQDLYCRYTCFACDKRTGDIRALLALWSDDNPNQIEHAPAWYSFQPWPFLQHFVHLITSRGEGLTCAAFAATLAGHVEFDSLVRISCSYQKKKKIRRMTLAHA